MAIGCSDEDILRDNTITEHVLVTLWTLWTVVAAMTLLNA